MFKQQRDLNVSQNSTEANWTTMYLPMANVGVKQHWMTATSLNQFLPVLMALSVGAQELIVRLPEIIHFRLKACI